MEGACGTPAHRIGGGAPVVSAVSRLIRAAATRAALMALYATCIVVYCVAAPFGWALSRRPRRSKSRSVLVLATFYTRNWCISHLMPLARAANVGRVIAIVDGPTQPIEGVMYLAPPGWMVRL